MKHGVFVTESVYIPQDERSRTNPGHGYPAETRKFQVLKEFDTKEQLEQYLLKNQKTVKSRVIQFEDVDYTIKLLVDLK
jgi:hypothetical protein